MSEQEKVLVVDDDAEVVRGITTWLSAAGFTTITAHDGLGAIAKANGEGPDAIVLDVRMPRMSGLQALAELKQCAATQQIPVVMLSASLVDQQRALDGGARFFMKKPYNGKALVKAVRAALDDCPNMRNNHERNELPTLADHR